MKKPTPEPTPEAIPEPQSGLADVPQGAGNVWADHAATRSGGRHVFDEAAMVLTAQAPITAVEQAAPLPAAGPMTSEET